MNKPSETPTTQNTPVSVEVAMNAVRNLHLFEQAEAHADALYEYFGGATGVVAGDYLALGLSREEAEAAYESDLEAVERIAERMTRLRNLASIRERQIGFTTLSGYTPTDPTLSSLCLTRESEGHIWCQRALDGLDAQALCGCPCHREQPRYLAIRVEQYASDEAYPSGEQQGVIMGQVEDQVIEDFPFRAGESLAWRQWISSHAIVLWVRLNGNEPSQEHIAALRDVRPYGYAVYDDIQAPRVTAYQVMDEADMRRYQAMSAYAPAYDWQPAVAL